MKALTALCLLALFALPNAAAAQTPVQAKPDAKAIELAHTILIATHVDSNALAGIAALTPAMVAMLKRDKADIPDSIIQKFIPIFEEKMKASIPQILDMEAEVYARHYSLQELTEISRFYQSDVGKKVIQEAPLIMNEILPIGEAWGRDSGIRAMQDAIATLRKQGVKI